LMYTSGTTGNPKVSLEDNGAGWESLHVILWNRERGRRHTLNLNLILYR
jgi:acyl-coenzyme A synthetase/AMP-(fatty) acid ligase